MKKLIPSFSIALMSAVSVIASADRITITGEVTSVRNGQAATFYTVTASDGKCYIANGAMAQVHGKEAIFQQAFAEKKRLNLEFRSNDKHPDNIWLISKIEIADGAVPTVSPTPTANVTPAATPFAPEPNNADLVAAVSPPPVAANKLSASGIFKDGMVLQRDMPVPVWGWAPAGMEVSVDFSGQKKSAKADASGHWQVTLDPLTASSEPRKMTVQSGAGELKFANVLVGEVWVLSGQSNMEWWLEDSDGGKAAVQAADYPWLRYCSSGFQLPDAPARDLSAKAEWQVCSPTSAGQFSAIGFWFARRLHEELKVPVGLIKNAVSGTYGECWVPREVLESIPAAQPRLKEYEDALKVLPQETARWEKEKAEWNLKCEEAKKSGTPPPEGSLFLRKGPMGPKNNLRPCALYNGLVAPVMPYAVRGVLWYQGEGNSQKQRVGYYREILEGLVGSWRKGWNQPKLPFVIVQLPRFEPGLNNDWPQLREAQRQAVAGLSDAHLVVTIDTGDPKTIHPTNKQPVAKRAAEVALQRVYGKDIHGLSPVPLAVEHSRDSLLVRFSDVGRGLSIGSSPVEGAGPGTPRCFEIAGEDGKFTPAMAELVGADQVRLKAAGIIHPSKVRYAYSNVPDINLYSGDGIPVGPFSAEATR